LRLAPLAAIVPNAILAISIASVIALAHMAWLVHLTFTIVELFPAKAAGLVAAGSGCGGMVSSEIIACFVAHQGYLQEAVL
jgi:ACS family hexuronate transporter-like MFS transporter